jgi:hypothetical protein
MTVFIIIISCPSYDFLLSDAMSFTQSCSKHFFFEVAGIRFHPVNTVTDAMIVYSPQITYVETALKRKIEIF